MKKLIAMILSIVMMFSAVTVSGATLDFLRKPILNYTATGETKFSFDNADEVFAFIEQYADDYDSGDVVDLKILAQSIADFGSTAYVQADISEDYKKVKLAVTSASNHKFAINQNLAIGLDVKNGIWLDIDLTDTANPKCGVIASLPSLSKYVHFDLFEMLREYGDDEDMLMVQFILTAFVNEEFISSVCKFAADRYEMYGNVTEENGVVTIKLDNDGFLKLIDDLLEYVVTEVYTVFTMGMPITEELEIPSVHDLGLKILGEDGYVTTYCFDGENIASVESALDIELSVKNICEVLGEEYELEEDLPIKFTFTSKESYTNVGSTTVEFPVLNESNSITLKDAIEGNDSYPYYWVEVEFVPLEGKDVLYVPFDDLMFEAYSDKAEISREQNKITVTSEYFDNFDVLTFTVGESKAYLDEDAVEVGEIVEENGKVYVSELFIKAVFGWKNTQQVYSLIDGKCEAEFDTDPYYDDDSDYTPEEDEDLYPIEYVSFSADYVPTRTQLYVPFRQFIENAYGDGADIAFDNGVITVTSNYFDGFNALSFKAGESVAYLDGNTVEVDEIIIEDGTTYVSINFISEIFGFVPTRGHYDYLDNVYRYTFRYGYDESEDYPYGSPYVYAEYVPDSSDVIYVPMNEMLECAYDETFECTVDGVNVTVTGEYFNEFEAFSLTVGSSKAVVGEKEIDLGSPVISENGEVYVPSELFELGFGWVLDEAYYDALDKEYYISFDAVPFLPL